MRNPAAGNYVIGFYNLSSTEHDDNEVNVEVVLNTNNGEIKFIYGDFGSNFQKVDMGSNTMIGISGICHSLNILKYIIAIRTIVLLAKMMQAQLLQIISQGRLIDT